MENNKKAITIKSRHSCPLSNGQQKHLGGPPIESAQSVKVEGAKVCRKGDKLFCVGPNIDEITSGSTVIIENKPAATLASTTKHGGKIETGASTVFFG